MHFFIDMDPPTKTYQEHRVGISKFPAAVMAWVARVILERWEK